MTERLVPPLSAEQRAAFLAAARAYIDTPFGHRGRSDCKIDCLGVGVCALADIGITTADERLYGRSPEPDGDKLRATLVEHFGEPIFRKGDPIELLVPSCIVSMRWHKRPNHVGIIGNYYLGGLSLIHADAAVGRVVEHALASHWPRRVLEGWLP